VLKGRQHAAPQRPGSPPRIDTLVVFGADAVRRRLDELRALGAEPIGQEYVTGELLAYSAVTDRDAEVGADSMQVASRIWPPYAGASCRAVTVQVDETIATKARALFLDLGWFGLAELQFVVPADGRPRLIDFNGRFYGSLALAVAAGANLPAIWAALASGRRVRRTRARPGVRYQWLEGDLRRAGRERRGGLLRDGVTTIASAGSATHSLWSWRDPWPALQRGRAALGEATFGAGR
jgi:predicted ATP-grasp superfamily ATP-dependent carboligase